MPDSPEARIARLDESLKNLLNRLEAISEAYAPTNRTVIENALKIAELQKDLDDLERQFVKQIERREELIRGLENQLLACSHSVSDLEKRWEKHRIAQENRERRARELAEQKARDDRITRNRWIIGIVAAFVTAVVSVYLGTVLG